MPSLLVKNVDLREVDDRFREAIAAGRSLDKAMKLIRPELQADQRDHAARQQGPDGTWPKRSLGTLRHGKGKRRLSRRPLGRLLTAVQYRASATQVTAESKIPWSGSHQEGDVVGQGARLPQRTFLWISDKMIAVGSRIVQRLIVDVIGGG